MIYKGREVSVKWHAHIIEIKDDKIIVEMLEMYPIASILKYNIDLPIKMFKGKDIPLGLCFYLYALGEELVVEWIDNIPLTKEEIEEIEKSSNELYNELKWN